MKPLITKADVEAALERLKNQGRKATFAAIHAELENRGSLTTIAKLRAEIEQRKELLPVQASQAEETFREVWAQAVNAGRQEIQQELADERAEAVALVALNERLEGELSAAAERRTILEAEIASLREQLFAERGRAGKALEGYEENRRQLETKNAQLEQRVQDLLEQLERPRLILSSEPRNVRESFRPEPPAIAEPTRSAKAKKR